MIYEKAFEIFVIILIVAVSFSFIGCGLRDIGKFIAFKSLGKK